MTTTKFGISGGIAPAGLVPVHASIGLATESDSAFPTAGDLTETTVTRFGIDGGIQNGFRRFSEKTRFAGKAQESDSAFAVVDPNDVIGVIGLSTESDDSRPMGVGAPPVITPAVSSIRGTDIITADNTLTVNVDNSSAATSITVNGVATSLFTVVTPTELTCVVPRGIGAPYSTNVDVVVNSTFGASAPFSALWEPPFGMVETDFSVAYAGLDPDSPFAGDLTFQDITDGPPADSCIYDAVTTPDSLGVSMDGTGVFSITGTITQIQVFDYYIYDASDDTVSPTVEQITFHPGPVEAAIGQASETDSTFSVTSLDVITGIIGLATEVDSAFAVVDGSIFTGAIGLATEADSAFTVAGGNTQVVAIGLTTEADSAFSMVDGSVSTGLINQVQEGDFAFPVVDAGAVTYQISRAIETDSAFGVSFPATLDSIREQIEVLEASMNANFAAQQLILDELRIRFDLNVNTQNTYNDDGSLIANDEFTLTKTDNLNGTFDITRS